MTETNQNTTDEQSDNQTQVEQKDAGNDDATNGGSTEPKADLES